MEITASRGKHSQASSLFYIRRKILYDAKKFSLAILRNKRPICPKLGGQSYSVPVLAVGNIYPIKLVEVQAKKAGSYTTVIKKEKGYRFSTSFELISSLLDFNERSVKDSSSSKCCSRVLISLWLSFFNLRKASVLLSVVLTTSSPKASLVPSI